MEKTTKGVDYIAGPAPRRAVARFGDELFRRRCRRLPIVYLCIKDRLGSCVSIQKTNKPTRSGKLGQMVWVGASVHNRETNRIETKNVLLTKAMAKRVIAALQKFVSDPESV